MPTFHKRCPECNALVAPKDPKLPEWELHEVGCLLARKMREESAQYHQAGQLWACTKCGAPIEAAQGHIVQGGAHYHAGCEPGSGGDAHEMRSPLETPHFPGKVLPVDEIATPYSGDKITMPSGASSSHGAPTFTLIPLEALVALAKRYSLGVEKHGFENWKRGIEDPKWIEDRVNHCIVHTLLWWLKYRGAIAQDGDDDAGAVAWAGTIMVAVDEARKQKR